MPEHRLVAEQAHGAAGQRRCGLDFAVLAVFYDKQLRRGQSASTRRRMISACQANKRVTGNIRPKRRGVGGAVTGPESREELAKVKIGKGGIHGYAGNLERIARTRESRRSRP